jgi:hypothetical protein
MITVSANISFSPSSGGYTFGGDNFLGDGTNNGQLLINLPGILNVYEPVNTCAFTVHSASIRLNQLTIADSCYFTGVVEPGSSYIQLFGNEIAANNYTAAVGNRFPIRTGSVSIGGVAYSPSFNFTFTYFTDDKSYIKPTTTNTDQFDPFLG